MDEANTHNQVHDHADAVVRGDMETVLGDFSDELRPHTPQLAQSLPQPVTAAEVLSLEVGDEESVAQIRYSGDSASVTIQSHWQEIDGRPRIVAGQIVS